MDLKFYIWYRQGTEKLVHSSGVACGRLEEWMKHMINRARMQDSLRKLLQKQVDIKGKTLVRT